MAAAQAKSLSDLVLELLPSFKSRGQETFYVAMLRAEVEKKTKKHYRDKEEWKVALRKLHTAASSFTTRPVTRSRCPRRRAHEEAGASWHRREGASVSLPTETGA